MVTEVVRSYWQIANGLRDGTQQRAAATARAVLSGDVAATPVPGALGQLQALTEELLALAASNRDLVRGVVAAEVDRALQAVGFASGDEVAALRRSVERLSTRVADLEQQLAAPAPPPPPQPAQPTRRAPAARRSPPAAGGRRRPGRAPRPRAHRPPRPRPRARPRQAARRGSPRRRRTHDDRTGPRLGG
jgi:hypothetical protein